MISTRFQTVLLLTVAACVSACAGQGVPPAQAPRIAAAPQGNVENSSRQSVAYQIDVEHTGYSRGPLHLPLQQLWSDNLGGSHGDVQYPVIANGIVVVIADEKLIALDEKTGKKLWTHDEPNDFGWFGPAYDNGAVFVASVASYRPYIGLYAFDERTGKKLWSARSLGDPAPPTAASGVVYTSTEGGDGGVFAHDESTGALDWKSSIGGRDSSPVVTSKGIYVSYACPITYALQPSDGQVIWRYAPNTCEGGGGSTPVLYKGLLFVEDIDSFKYTGVVLDAKDGTAVGNFDSTTTPAFAHNLGFFIDQSTLTAQSIPSLKQVWSASLETSDGYQTPPLIVDDIVYAGTIANDLVGYDVKTGKRKVLQKLPTSSFYQSHSGSLGFGDGELVVPDGTYLVAFKGS